MSISLPSIYLNKLRELFAAKEHGTHVSSSNCVTSVNGSKGDVTVTLGTFIPSGAIMWFYLSSAPEGWKVCDGTNGTPNLIGKYPLGATSNIGTPVNASVSGLYIKKDGYTGSHTAAGDTSGALAIYQYWGAEGHALSNKLDSNIDVLAKSSASINPPSVKLLPCMKI